MILQKKINIILPNKIINKLNNNKSKFQKIVNYFVAKFDSLKMKIRLKIYKKKMR